MYPKSQVQVLLVWASGAHGKSYRRKAGGKKTAQSNLKVLDIGIVKAHGSAKDELAGLCCSSGKVYRRFISRISKAGL